VPAESNTIAAMSQNGLLVGIRTAVGAGTWVAPRLAGRMFGLDAVANPQLPYVGRLFGIRDVALGAGLSMSSGESRKLWLQLGILCDAADAVAGVLAGRKGELSKASTALVTAPALLGMVLGVAALQAADADAAPPIS
jgi:hypothetical protein